MRMRIPALAAAALLAAGCADFLATPAAPPARLALQIVPEDPGAIHGFFDVDRMHVRLERDLVPVVDTSFPVDPASAERSHAIPIPLDDPEAEMDLTVELLRGTRPRWTGSATVLVKRGVQNSARMAMEPASDPGRLYGRVRDLQTLAPIPGATVTLAGPGPASTRVLPVDASGRYAADSLAPGTYGLLATAPGHTPNAAVFRVATRIGGDVVQVGFDLPAGGTGLKVTGVAGRVLGEDGAPVAGATVMISGGAATNGVFKSVLTAADGTYVLTGVSLTANNAGIPSFSVIAAAAGRVARRVDDVVLADSLTRANVDFALPPSAGAQVYFADGFETGGAWQTTGLWNRTTGAGIVNAAVPSESRLAPDDPGPASLPAAAEGTRYLWYGTPAAGNFVGGGSNSGDARSPAFVIPAGTPVASLSFRTWFDVESVNPASHDLMTVSIVDVAAGTTRVIAELNPSTDPNIEDREEIAFTSGGFNRAPVWRPVSLDVTAYAGRQIRILLQFRTEDDLYNYFRGWIVDDVRVTSEPPAFSLGVRRPPFAPARTPVRRPR